MAAQDLISRFTAFLDAYAATGRKPLHYPGGLVLYKAELHTIEAIGNTPGLNVTQLAARQSITKGAASQTLRKLSEKGLIEKRPVANAPGEVALHLTANGQTVYTTHAAHHTTAYTQRAQTLENATPETRATLNSLMQTLENMLQG